MCVTVSLFFCMCVCVVLHFSLPPDLMFEASASDKIKKLIKRGVNSCVLPFFLALIKNCRRHLSRLLRHKDLPWVFLLRKSIEIESIMHVN